jgi:hypothetical protein
MSPRRLEVIFIDDAPAASKDVDPTQPRPHVPPDSVKGFSRSISSWKGAVEFWAGYSGDAFPDLVVADIRFDRDYTSPLSRVALTKENNLPTGLSHVKPFAAVARATGRVVSVSIYTGQRKLWSRLANSVHPVDQCMGLLAAHEIGELAAILGEEITAAAASEENSLKSLWEWLEGKTGTVYEEALKIAIRNYRKRLLLLVNPSDNELPSVFVMPSDYTAALTWCEGAKENPPLLDATNDPGIVLTYKDGTRDSIYLSSIFGDALDITTRRLKPPCFAVSSGENDIDPAELDYRGDPQIGAFIAQLGKLQSVYEEAVRKVHVFPYLPDQAKESGAKLRDVVPGEGDGHLVRGLVVVFQLIRIEQYVFHAWEERYKSNPWDAQAGAWASDLYDQEKSLRKALHRLLNLIHSLPRRDPKSPVPETFSRDEFLSEVCGRGIYGGVGELTGEGFEWVAELSEDDADEDWFRWHFERLVDAGILDHTARDEYIMVSSETSFGTPPVPKSFPNSKSVSEALGLPVEELGSTMRMQWLRGSLGYSADSHILFRMLYRAFTQHGAETPAGQEKLGRDFYAQLVAGRVPGWMLSLCQQYARYELRWRSRRTWPDWIRPKL